MKRAVTGIVRRFRMRIEDEAFPCVGAKAAMAKDHLHMIAAGDLRSAASDVAVVAALQAFAKDTSRDALFVSAVVLFGRTPALDEVAFERALWERLRSFHALDRVDHSWDASVSADSGSPHFSLSLGGRAFYVVGLHPGANRVARRFCCAALVFNLHSQFEALRAEGRYEKLREAITLRDIAYSGSRNPMLAAHGTVSEARQYSGREVDAAWRCPFPVDSGKDHDGA